MQFDPLRRGAKFRSCKTQIVLLRVEIFPVERSRWIAVVEAPRGSFSTECRRPEEIPREVDSVIREVLNLRQFELVMVDDLGVPWVMDAAEAQARRLGVA